MRHSEGGKIPLAREEEKRTTIYDALENARCKRTQTLQPIFTETIFTPVSK